MSEALDGAAEKIESTELAGTSATLTERIRERPLVSLGLASLAGFVVGGGAVSRTGAAMLMLVARIWLRRAANDALAEAITSYGTAKRNGQG